MEVWVCKHFGVRLFESKDEFMRCIFREKNGSDICLPKRTPDGTTHNPCDAKKFVEEKVGKWIHQEYSPMPDERMYYNGEMWRCSCCENIKAFKSDYCPNCGARMTDD